MRSTQRVRQRSIGQALAKRNLTNTETSCCHHNQEAQHLFRDVHTSTAPPEHTFRRSRTQSHRRVSDQNTQSTTNTSRATRSSHTATPIIRNDSPEHLRGCRRRRTLKRSPIIRQKGKGSPALHIHLSETAQTKSDAWPTPRWTPHGRHRTWQAETGCLRNSVSCVCANTLSD